MKYVEATSDTNHYKTYEKLYRKKGTPVTHKRKTVLLRLVRTLAATLAGLLAAWLSGPEALGLISDPASQSFVVAVVVPTLVAIDKMLRYGSDDGEE